MHSLKELYQIGPGPSSSHTIAPWKGCLKYQATFPEAEHFEIILYGGLALTGKGHFSDAVIQRTLFPKSCEVIFRPLESRGYPLTFTIVGRNQYYVFPLWEIVSLGGGSIRINGNYEYLEDIYPHTSFQEIKEFCLVNRLSLPEYAYYFENDIRSYLGNILSHMLKTVDNGLKASGVLPGKLELIRVAKNLQLKAGSRESSEEKGRLMIMAYAYGASEENAAGHMTVTAPTLGASGVMPAVMKYFYEKGTSKNRLIDALATAGIFGNLVKTNATISGAVGGCQAEIGTACAMAAAAIGYLEEMNIDQIEAAAEIAMEHHLGLTCDPVGGYVMIPCIERNAVASLRAFDAVLLARNLLAIRENRVSFDMIVETMKYTGQKIARELKETSLGGLATQIIIEK